MWAKRIVIASGVALASVLMVPNLAGADTTSNCVVTESMQEPTCVVVPTVSATSDGLTPTATAAALPFDGTTPSSVTPVSSSLPFTGADVEELAVVGLGAVLAGGLLLRRRRRTS